MTEAADVPLICDPVPGPGIITINRVVPPEELDRLHRIWEAASAESPRRPLLLEGGGIRVAPLAGSRTEWPDAEFCAA